VRLPGDEWGDAQKLRDQYTALVRRLRLPQTVNVLEIGAGGGRSTAALLDVLGERAGSYHVIDVADAFVDTLRARVSRPLDIHNVTQVDVSMIEDKSLYLVLAQSSWSHIRQYDQYRYLRDLRSKLKHRAPVFVSGLFVVGAGDGWTWNRFRRRVHQVEQQISGVYHEFTSVGMLTEMLTRLGYEDIIVFAHGFTARRGRLVGDQYLAELPDGIDYRFERHLHDWVDSGASAPGHLPPVRVEVVPVPVTGLTRIRRGLVRRARRLVRRGR
jgi:SAM-dependent methyltransferase